MAAGTQAAERRRRARQDARLHGDTRECADYAEGDRVEVRFPLTPGTDRDAWPWLPGSILGGCDEIGHEFHVRVDVEDLADEDADGERWYPACFRTPDELRPAR